MANATKTPKEQAVELLVYAPIGLALEVREALPRLVERGRGQVVLAQLIGRVAADRGRAEVARNMGRFAPVSTAARSAPAPTGSAPTDAAPAGGEEDEVVDGPTRSVEDVLPGYDDLPAADVVRELADLEPDALEIVRRYEQDHRRRITVLNKIDRLRQG